MKFHIFKLRNGHEVKITKGRSDPQNYLDNLKTVPTIKFKGVFARFINTREKHILKKVIEIQKKKKKKMGGNHIFFKDQQYL